MPAPPAFVFFDLDDTLLDHGHAERAALADLHVTFGDHVGHHALAHLHTSYRASNAAELWADYGAGRISSDELKRLRSERFLAAVGATGLDPLAFSSAYLDRYAAHWTWAPGAEAAFHRIADALPVGILTNGFLEQQRGKLARFPEIARRAAVVVVSEEVGVAKPHRGVFDHALGEASRVVGRALAPDEVLMVGDSRASDIDGALAAGWQAVWVGGDPASAPDGVAVCATCAEWADGWRALER
ncbi:MAG TPA: HAD-IA family hydrolase [Rubricoccaceae bacterium]|jgi:HAD superfamily hydrolase (TIGR01549 family)